MKSESKPMRNLSNPLSVEHLLRVQAIYNLFRIERTQFSDFPIHTSWFRIRYMNKHTRNTLGSVKWEVNDDELLITMSLNRILFDEDTNPTLLYGVIHHEMCHLLLGPGEKHSRTFHHLEVEWRDYWYYETLKEHYFRTIKE